MSPRAESVTPTSSPRRTSFRLATGCMLLAIGLALVGFGLLLIPHGVPYGVLAAILLALMGGTIVFYLLGRMIGVCEARSGYTTLTHRYRELPQLESRSGKVIRPAGDPYRSPAHREARQNDNNRDCVFDHLRVFGRSCRWSNSDNHVDPTPYRSPGDLAASRHRAGIHWVQRIGNECRPAANRESAGIEIPSDRATIHCCCR